MKVERHTVRYGRIDKTNIKRQDIEDNLRRDKFVSRSGTGHFIKLGRDFAW